MDRFPASFPQPFEFIQIRKNLSPRRQNLPYSSRQFFPSGTPVVTVVAGKDRRLRLAANVAARPGRFQSKGSPAATDERCVLDEHIGGTGEGRPPACRGDIRRKCLKHRHSRDRAAERTGTEIAGRAVCGSHLFIKRASRGNRRAGCRRGSRRRVNLPAIFIERRAGHCLPFRLAQPPLSQGLR